MTTPLTDTQLNEIEVYATVNYGFNRMIPSNFVRELKRMPNCFYKSFGDNTVVRIERVPSTAPFATAGSFLVSLYKKDKFNKFSSVKAGCGSVKSTKSLDRLVKKYGDAHVIEELA